MWLWLLVLGATADAKTQATEALRKGQLGRACALFKQVVASDPKDAPGWSDLGLCLAKQGKKAAAIDALDHAVAGGDAETRLHAYYSLGKYGLRAAPLDALDTAEASRPFEHPAGCARSAGVRFHSYRTDGNEWTSQADGLWVGTPAWVDLERDGLHEDFHFNVSLWSFDQATAPHCARQCGPCSLWARQYGAESGAFAALEPRIARCLDARQRGCRFADAGEDCVSVVEGCQDAACDDVLGREAPPTEAQRAALSPDERAFAADYVTCMEACDAHFTSPPDRDRSPWKGCSLVSVNLCASRAGFICPAQEGRGVQAREEAIIDAPAPDAGQPLDGGP
jgi:tetratricopeptide (TPR) repeat protein